MDSISSIEKPAVRRVQAIHGDKTFVIVLPRDFVEKLRISKGDYVTFTVIEESIVVKKADL